MNPDEVRADQLFNEIRQYATERDYLISPTQVVRNEAYYVQIAYVAEDEQYNLRPSYVGGDLYTFFHVLYFKSYLACMDIINHFYDELLWYFTHDEAVNNNDNS